MGYNEDMDILLRLEQEVQNLVSELHAVQARLDKAGGLCAALQEENLMLRRSLASEQAMREKALAQIDAVIDRINGHIGAEKVS